MPIREPTAYGEIPSLGGWLSLAADERDSRFAIV
jgi:hypothetical protein